MSAPRVPEGWTKRAADFVWDQWCAVLSGRDFRVLVNGWSHSDLESIPGLRLKPLPMTYAEAEELYHVERASPDARLRAWAAVGASVIAPRAEGEAAPLWEWVRAAEESALGKPRWEAFGQDDELQGRFAVRGPLAGVRVSVLVAGSAPCGFVVDGADSGADCSTPAELRAALDKLAAEVKP